MQLNDFLDRIEGTTLTERTAEAYFRKRVMGQSRDKIAEKMDCSKSNVDNLTQTAQEQVQKAVTTVTLMEDLLGSQLD